MTKAEAKKFAKEYKKVTKSINFKPDKATFTKGFTSRAEHTEGDAELVWYYLQEDES